jgi:hypothetical protein
MSDAHPLTRTDAEQALQEVSAARELTRGALNASWLALLIWGVIVIVSAPFTQIGDGGAVAFYWLVATPLGFTLTHRAYRSFELKAGVEDRYENAYTAIIAAMVIAAVTTGIAGQGDMLSAVGPLFAIGLGFLAIASVRSFDALVGLAGGGMIALGIVLLILEPDEPGLIAALGQGVILIVSGVIAYSRRSRLDIGADASR